MESQECAESDVGAFSAGQFLRILHSVYLLMSRAPGDMVKLVDLYRILSLVPAAGPLYTKAAFALDVYLLDRHHDEASSDSGLVFRLDPGSTAARRRSNLLFVTTRDGAEGRYYGIEFVHHADSPEVDGHPRRSGASWLPQSYLP